ncbi:hypothetical protein KM043_015423 [Ampulex compressa]|nr:hypothetical protein KM043_015423 [Ampulex compressa]
MALAMSGGRHPVGSGEDLDIAGKDFLGASRKGTEQTIFTRMLLCLAGIEVDGTIREAARDSRDDWVSRKLQGGSLTVPASRLFLAKSAHLSYQGGYSAIELGSLHRCGTSLSFWRFVLAGERGVERRAGRCKPAIGTRAY